MGSPEDLENYVTAVIHRAAFNRLKEAIERGINDTEAEIVLGGNGDTAGYFVSLTVFAPPILTISA